VDPTPLLPPIMGPGQIDHRTLGKHSDRELSTPSDVSQMPYDRAMPRTWFKVAIGVLVVVEWVLIALVGGLAVWAFLSWLVPPGACTGITCW
jgi:hypothetical protein